MDIKLKVSREKFDEQFSVDEWFNFSELTNEQIYNHMIHFVVDNDGNYLSTDEARKLFKTVKKKEWQDYVTTFYKAVGDAFVSPTNGGN